MSFIAETVEDYQHHMTAAHPGEVSRKELSFGVNIGRQAILFTIERWPFCLEASASCVEEHITQHLQVFAVLSLDIPDIISQQPGSKTSFTVGSSVASDPLKFHLDDDGAKFEPKTRGT